jgi:hypothetical protein
VNASGLEAFDELAEFYPGSRHKRRALAGAWDDRPYRKVIGGVEREFFAIGALGKALDRPLVTLRLWIRQGHLPQATYRLPTKQVPVFDADGTQIETREQKGRRLYTREQILAVVRIATQHGLLGAVRIEWSEHPTFAQEIADAWRALKRA